MTTIYRTTRTTRVERRAAPKKPVGRFEILESQKNGLVLVDAILPVELARTFEIFFKSYKP